MKTERRKIGKIGIASPAALIAPSPIDKEKPEAEEHHSSIINELLSEIIPEQQKDVDIKMLQEAIIGLEEELRQAREEIKTLKK